MSMNLINETNVSPEVNVIPPEGHGKNAATVGFNAHCGFSKNSGRFSKNVIFFGQEHGDRGEDEDKRQAYGRVSDIPNSKKEKTSYFLKYNPELNNPDMMGSFTTMLPNTKQVKDLPRAVFV